MSTINVKLDTTNHSSLSKDVYQLAMISRIGSIQPFCSTIAEFLQNHQILPSNYLQTIFDDENSADEKLELYASIQNSQFFPSSEDNDIYDSRVMIASQHRPNEENPCLLTSLQHAIDEISANSHVTSSFFLPPSRPDVLIIPDAYAESVDVDIFSDLLEESIEQSSSNNIVKKVIPPQSSLLHQACFLCSQSLSVVKFALLLETANLRRRVPTPQLVDAILDSSRRKRFKRGVSLTLPIHIAIEYQGSFEVIKFLAEVAPDVIALTDGPNDCNAVSAMLYQRRFDYNLLSLLIKMNSYSLQVVDRYNNTSLHVACAHGAPLEVIEKLCKIYPKALLQNNLAGLNPLQVGQQNNLCSINVIDLLQDLTLNPLEQQCCHLLD
jgi:hypothetical protein